jgi:nucleoside-diphosphate-sugar epimerase
MKPIKVVYNWIGPAGAIPNDEPPNLVNIADALECTQVQSHRFYSDAMMNKFFKGKEFEIAPSFMLEGVEKFIYPFSLGWRIPFNQYFYSKNGLLEWGHVPNHIIHYVRDLHGYFLIDMSVEAYIEHQHLSAMHSYFDDHGIPLHKIIYLTGCMNAEEMYNKWRRQNNIVDDGKNRLTLISYPTSHTPVAHHAQNPENEPTYDIGSIPSKLFLVWNRRFRPHRVSLALLLESEGLVDRSYFSMNKVSDESSYDTFFEHRHHAALVGLSLDIVERLNNKLPLIIDGETDVGRMCGDFDNATRKFYQDSLVSLISETNFLESEVTLTEKSFKPVKEKHPFISVGAPGTLTALKKLGFKTFSDFWSEEYDNIQDPWNRLREIKRICVEISQWDSTKILDFKKNVQSVIEHNYNNLKIDTSLKVSTLIANKINGKNMKKILVCGAGGFIGSHLVNNLKSQGHYVIGADLKHPEYMSSQADEFHTMDLRVKDNVANLIKEDIDEIYQFAADMGGAGYIFTGDNDADIMHNSSLINLNILDEVRVKKIKKILYSSSACIYPAHNQVDPNNPICNEASAYPANPDSEYGWEKLFSEHLYMSYARNYGIDIRIVRFHNVFGPYGSWNNGKEKAPAALCRKVAQSSGEVEVWGDGMQTRSFLFIEDAIEGINRIMDGEYREPLNLGSSRMISINELVMMIAGIAGKEITIKHINGPKGVNGRTSDNKLITEKLGWQPPDRLQDGITKTYKWIQGLI